MGGILSLFGLAAALYFAGAAARLLWLLWRGCDDIQI
jgi:hypothetical protein